jgi:hypothetical protein
MLLIFAILIKVYNFDELNFFLPLPQIFLSSNGKKLQAPTDFSEGFFKAWGPQQSRPIKIEITQSVKINF